MPLDWSKITLPSLTKTKIQVSKLAALDYAKVLVIAQLTASSQSQLGREALYRYLEQVWPNYEERLTIEANNRGLTIEECFVELVKEAMGNR